MIYPSSLSVPFSSNMTHGISSSVTPSIEPFRRRVSPPLFSSVTVLAGTKIAFLLGNSQTHLYRFNTKGVKKTKKAKARWAVRLWSDYATITDPWARPVAYDERAQKPVSWGAGFSSANSTLRTLNSVFAREFAN